MTLNDQQLEAIGSPFSYTLVIAGPGSGKTAVLVERIVQAIRDGVDPQAIVAITFTNAAGREIMARVSALLGAVGESVKLGYIGTIHGYAMRLLRKYGDCIGLPAQLSVMDEAQAQELLEKVAGSLHYKGTQKALGEAVEELLNDFQGRGTANPCGGVASLVAFDYLNGMLDDGMLSFDAIIAFALPVLAECGSKLPSGLLLVDEYQDCNNMIHRFCICHPGIKFFVGDPDQAIYGFNGGNLYNMLAMAKSPTWKTLVLDFNYRSTPEICEVANRLIERNRSRVKKQLIPKGVTALEEDRWPVRFMQLDTPAAEVAHVLVELRTGLKHGKTCAVLCRSNFIAEATGVALEAEQIPVRKKQWAQKPLDWSVVRRFLSLVSNPDNDTLAYFFLKMTRGQAFADRQRLEAAEAGRSINSYMLKLPRNLDVRQVPDILKRLNITPDSIAIVERAMETLPAEADVAELALALGSPELNYKEVGNENDVAVTTMHAAKGREWDWVFILGADDAVIPGNAEGSELAEERRLMFVAVTRAKERLVVTTSRVRRVWDWMKTAQPAVPSRFCYELGIVQ